MGRKKALIVVTSHSQLGDTGESTGWYLPEVAHPYFRLVAAGLEVEFASPRGGDAPADEGSLRSPDEESARFLKDPTLMSRLQRTLAPEQLAASDYAAILFAGGHGTMWDFPNNARLAAVTAAIHEQGGVVAAVCHGPAALVNVKGSDGRYLVAGKKLATFTNEEERAMKLDSVVPFLLETALRERGAEIQLGPNWQENVVVDARLITGQNPQSAAKLGAEVARLLG